MLIYRKLERPAHVGMIWKPTEPGELVVGDYEGSEAGEYGTLFLFREPQGRLRKVPDWPCMKDFADQFAVGQRYRLTLVKMVPLKNGKETRDIDAEEILDDERPDDSNETTAPLDAEVPF